MSKSNPHILNMVIFNNQSHFSSTSPHLTKIRNHVQVCKRARKTFNNFDRSAPCVTLHLVLQNSTYWLSEWLGSDKYDEISSNNCKKIQQLPLSHSCWGLQSHYFEKRKRTWEVHKQRVSAVSIPRCLNDCIVYTNLSRRLSGHYNKKHFDQCILKEGGWSWYIDK